MVQVLLSSAVFGCIDAAHLLEKMPTDLNHHFEQWLPLVCPKCQLAVTNSTLFIAYVYYGLKKLQNRRALQTATE